MLFQPPPPPEPGFTWANAAIEFVGFIGLFALYGAAGFGNIVLPGAGPTPLVIRRATNVGIVGVLVAFAALPLTVRRWWPAPEGRHAAAVAVMVRHFSRLALWSSGLLVLTGVITAWRHLKYLAALWTTPYGWTLDAKLLVVLAVAALG